MDKDHLNSRNFYIGFEWHSILGAFSAQWKSNLLNPQNGWQSNDYRMLNFWVMLISSDFMGPFGHVYFVILKHIAIHIFKTFVLMTHYSSCRVRDHPILTKALKARSSRILNSLQKALLYIPSRDHYLWRSVYQHIFYTTHFFDNKAKSNWEQWLLN
jgi:hypothetical protein